MPPAQPTARSVFDAAAAEYDLARPSYPATLFEELEKCAGPITGKLVLDCGAGTGIASRQLAERGATVVSLDIGEQMLRRALGRSPGSWCVLADGNRMPIRSASAELVTFAQSWHWFDRRIAAAEVARVLKPGGVWAAWWNQAKADGEQWFEDYQQVVSASCPGYMWQRGREERMTPDWADELVRAQGVVEPSGTVIVQWTRQVSVADWITNDRSKSYFIELAAHVRQRVLAEVAAIIAERFPDGQMTVPYITTLLLARKAG